MASTANTPKPEMDGWRSEKVTIGNYISLAIAIVFFSGVFAHLLTGGVSSTSLH